MAAQAFYFGATYTFGFYNYLLFRKPHAGGAITFVHRDKSNQKHSFLRAIVRSGLTFSVVVKM